MQNQLGLKFKQTIEKEFEMRAIMNSMSHAMLIMKDNSIQYVNSLFDHMFQSCLSEDRGNLQLNKFMYPQDIKDNEKRFKEEDQIYNNKARRDCIGRCIFRVHSN